MLIQLMLYLEPQTTIYKWLFQLDDSQSLHRKWLEITKHPFFNGCLGFQVGVKHLFLKETFRTFDDF